ncbi:MAG: hypothetical protein IJS62_05700 [Bacteroidales bacterium]|nr:hypothetical protein [Bacteroidales bacterium]
MRNSVIQILACCISALSCGNPAASSAGKEVRLETYRYADELQPSLLFDVSANGERQFVIPTQEPHLCLFGCDGPVTVRVRSWAEEIEDVVVRPLHCEWDARLDKDEICLTMHPFDKAVVEINGNEDCPLFIFANPIEEGSKPDRDDPSVLYFESGKIHRPGTIVPKAGQTVYLEGGAVVDGSLDIRNTDSVTVDGCGILRCAPDGARAVFVYRCDDFSLKNILCINKNNWTSFFAECNRLHADNYKVVAPISDNGAENDAFDVLGCRDVKVTRGFSYCHDDAFCIKSRKWNFGAPVENVLFEDCISWNCKRGNSFELGYELGYDVRNVTFRNICSVHSAGNDNVYRRGALSLHNGASGTVSDVLYENVWLEDPKEYGIHIGIIENEYNIGNGVQWSPGHIEGVTLKNIHIGHDAPEGNFIHGYDSNHRVSRVTIEGLWIGGRKILSAEDGRFDVKHADVIFQ